MSCSLGCSCMLYYCIQWKTGYTRIYYHCSMFCTVSPPSPYRSMTYRTTYYISIELTTNERSVWLFRVIQLNWPQNLHIPIDLTENSSEYIYKILFRYIWYSMFRFQMRYFSRVVASQKIFLEDWKNGSMSHSANIVCWETQ